MVSLQEALSATYQFYASLVWYWIVGGSYANCPYFKDNLHARCHVYSISLIFYLWDRPHYRNGTFQEDMKKNLRDVAIPGTGLPLSWFAYSRVLLAWFILVLYPLLACFSAVHLGKGDFSTMFEIYTTQLVAPQDWFSFWRLNCRLASYHAFLCEEPDFEYEDKWRFLQKAEEEGVAVTPTMKMPRQIICKHRNEEGGLGIHRFLNVSHGGDWIIQECLENSPFLKQFLPANPPLSTFRVISASRGGLSSGTNQPVTRDEITALSCVWRAGRKNAATDHSAILFNVDPNTGIFKPGTTNVHWYQRGLNKIFSTPWSSSHDQTVHPDSKAQITGVHVPDMKAIMDFACTTHLRICPHVPLVGWDVALTDNHGMVMLEGNFSCNFFRGDFDQEAYFAIVHAYHCKLDTLRRAGGPKQIAKSKLVVPDKVGTDALNLKVARTKLAQVKATSGCNPKVTIRKGIKVS
jgi:hypothetical protein